VARLDSLVRAVPRNGGRPDQHRRRYGDGAGRRTVSFDRTLETPRRGFRPVGDRDLLAGVPETMRGGVEETKRSGARRSGVPPPRPVS
jgi:hypothetical protein